MANQDETKVSRANACFNLAAHCGFRFPASEICVVIPGGLKLLVVALDCSTILYLLKFAYHSVFAYQCLLPVASASTQST
jgi:hypothetical protein